MSQAHSPQLIRHTPDKNRYVYFYGNKYRKVWLHSSKQWIDNHVTILNSLMPGYVINSGSNWIDFKIIEGTPASKFDHTPEFVDRIHKFCLSQIEEIKPLVHGDWTLSNMIINGDKITMIDWDNIGVYPMDQVYKKMSADLKSAFGELYVF